MEQLLAVGDLAQAVRARRLELGLTQAQLAERAHVSRKWISAVEGGKEGLQMKPVLLVCNALGLPLRLSESGPRSSVPRVAEPPVLDDSDINRRIRARAQATSFGGKLGGLGITTVALDDAGNLTRYHPDGSQSSVA